MLTIVPVPSVTQGVSQLDATRRSPSHASVNDNVWPTFDSGLQRRPPTQRVGVAVAGQLNDLAVHGIDYGDGTRYIVTASVGSQRGVQVMDTDGNQYPVYAAALPAGGTPSYGYLNTADPAAESLRFLSVQDYTFVLNRSRAVFENILPLAPDTDPVCSGIIFIKRGDYQAKYTLHFKAAAGPTTDQSVEVLTWNGTGAPVGNEIVDPYSAARGTIRTQDIAQAFKTELDLLAAANPTWGLQAVVSGTGESSVVHVKVTASTLPFITFRVETGSGGNDAVGFTTEVESEDDLPLVCATDYVVKVRPNAARNEGAYYLRFTEDSDTSGGISEGQWAECPAPGVRTQFDPATMPHALIRRTDTNGDVYFTFEAIDWDDRLVGDDDSNPFPSFVSTRNTVSGGIDRHYISDIAFFRERLALIGREKVAFSEAGRYFNFWRTSVATVLDSDPLFANTGSTTVSDLAAAVPFNRQLLLFSKTTQYVAEGEPLLTPVTLGTSPVTAYDMITGCRPVVTKRTVMFGHKRGNYSALFAMAPVDAANIGFDATDISIHVPKYIPGLLTNLIPCPQEDAVFCVSDADRRYLYVFRSYVEGENRLQAAWCRWDFGPNAEILGGAAFDSSLYLVVQRIDNVELERVDLSPGESTRWTYLDRQVDQDNGASFSYDAGTDTTLVAVPFAVNIDEQVAVVTPGGYWFPLVDNPASGGGPILTPAFVPEYTFAVRGDASAGALVGFLRDSIVAYEKPAVFRETPAGRVKARDGINWILGANVSVIDSGPVRAVVSNPDDQPPQDWGPPTVGLNPLDQYTGADGTFFETIGAPSDDVTLTLTASGPYPFNLEGIEWEIDYTPRGGRAP